MNNREPKLLGKKRKIVRFFILIILLALLLESALFAYSLVKNLPSPERITERAVAESTKIYDRTGKILLYEIHGEEKRTSLPLNEMPEAIKTATLAAEDINFYKHGGLDWKGIARAIVKNILKGELAQGGSTITQQLVKSSLLGPEKTFKRKIREQIISVLLEKKYSKDEILEMYLNQIPYGSNAYGIAAAAQTYFDKKANELTLGEIAILAALPKAPTYYSPYGSHKDALLNRRDWILERMAAAGFITPEELKKSEKEGVDFIPPRQNIRAPHFVMYLRDYLDEKYGEQFVEQGGLQVTTTLDWPLQEAAEKIIFEGAEQNEKQVQAANAALVAIDPRTGEILAMVGSKDYFGKSFPEGCKPGVNCRFDPNVNIVTRPRQPGSAFKPFVYSTAFKKGYTPETVLFDVPTEFNTRCNPDGAPGPEIKDKKDCYHPQNYDKKFRGPVSLRQALAQSLNVPSVKLSYLAGVLDSIKTAQEMGITTLTDPERYGLSLVLGGAEVTLLEMTSAFGVFAQEGILHPKTAILKIETSKGEVLEEKKDVSQPVLDTEIARLINDILSDNNARIPVFNPQSSLYFPDRQVAAKTGTTQDFRDAWVLGYTPSLVAGVWVGNNDNTEMNQSGPSVMVAGPLWHRFFDFVFNSSSATESFIAPSLKSANKPILRGIYRNGPVIKIDKISKKLATEFTPPELIEEIGTGEIKSILSLVKKDDPSGDPPANPDDDPQFKNWQTTIENWLKTNKLAIMEPPKDYDDLHTPEKRPKISFVVPALDKEINIQNTRWFTVSIKATFPLKEVSFFINDELIASKTTPITSEIITFSTKNELSPGLYKIKITAYDAVGNKETLEREVTVFK